MEKNLSFEELSKRLGISEKEVAEKAKEDGLIDKYNRPTVKGIQSGIITLETPNIVIDDINASIVFAKTGFSWKEINPKETTELTILYKKEVMSLTLKEVFQLKKFLNDNF